MNAEQFHPEKLLAGGPAAKVYRGVETTTGRKVLMKALLDEHESPHALDREKLQLMASSLMQVRHPQIAGLITMIPTEDEFALIYDFMPGLNIRGFAAARTASAADIRALAVQLMHALFIGEQLHQPHGDPKPSNLIIADHPGGGLFMQVQDWGLSLTRSVHPPESLWFRAPELHETGTPTTQSDLFTAAGSLFCLATNSAPAQGEDAADLTQQWQAFDMGHALRHLRPDLDAPLIDWLTWLSRPDPRQRPHSAAQALDMLMTTMHTGFIYMPQQAPQMAPGTQTTPLNRPPAAPRPKPVTTRPPSGTESQSDAAPPARPPRSKKRVFAAVVLNLAALGLAAVFGWGWLSANGTALWKDLSAWAGRFKVETVSAPAATQPAAVPGPAAAKPPTTVAATKAPSKSKSKPKTSKAKAAKTTAEKSAESKK